MSQEKSGTQVLLEKHSAILEGTEIGLAPIKGYDKKRVTAIVLENMEKELNAKKLQEGNDTGGIDISDPVLMNLVRRATPNLVAFEMAGVQPMTGPTGVVFAMRAFYGDQPNGPFGQPGDAGRNTGGTAQATNAANGFATGEAFYNEANTVFSGTGTQTSNATAPDYSTYSIGTGMATSAGETLGGATTWGEMSFTIEKAPVSALTRGLKASYTVELAQDLKSVHGLDAENELSGILSVELLAEQNREFVNRIRFVAKLGEGEKQYSNGNLVTNTAGAATLTATGTWDVEKNSDGRWSAEKYKSLLFKIGKEANNIAKDTRRGRGNFIIVSSDVALALDLSGKLIYSPAVENNLNADDTGPTFVGVLQGRYKVYVDPYIGYDEVIVGYKGPNQYDAGLFYCPYVPLQMYKATDPATLQPVMAFKTRYGVIANPFTTLNRNANTYFRKFKITNL